jgi:hypothetical protein
METGPDRIPSAQEARETLQQLSGDESAVRYPSLPWWFFIGQAALVAGLCLAQLLPPSDSPKATFAMAAAAIVMGVTQWLNRDGVSWVSVRFRDMVPFMAAVGGTIVLCLAVAETTGAWWIWIAGAVVGAGIVLRHGYVYRQVFGGDV